MTIAASRSPRAMGAWILGGSACLALLASFMSVNASVGSDARDEAVEMSQISEGIGGVAPNCRRIAAHRLKTRLDDGTRAALTHRDLDEVLGPLRKGGSDLCDTITGQSFTLGGN